MKEIYIIGNGFDLHHGLNTSYENYKKYLMKVNPDYVRQFDDFLKRYVFVKDPVTEDGLSIEQWSELEKYTEKIYEYDLNEILEKAVESAQTDADQAGYWHGVQYMCSVYSKWINGIRTSFADWIKTIECEKGRKDRSLHLNKNALYLNFNYTSTLECLYDIPPENILHIHGDVNHTIIFGNDKKPNKEIKDNTLPINHNRDADRRINESAEILNKVLRETNAYYKNTLSLIAKNKEFFERIRKCDKIIFMGFGFGEEDANYVREVLYKSDSLKTVVLYYHGEKEIHRFCDMLKKYLSEKIAVNYVKW